MSANTSLLMVGLPSSGKTTFLAALWHLLTNSESGAEVRLQTLGVDRTYLNEIRGQWLARRAVGRTPLGAVRSAALHVEAPDIGDRVLEIPDLSGELYEALFEKRVWPSECGEAVRRAAGLLVFVHPNMRLNDTTIIEANEALVMMESVAGSPVRGVAPAAPISVPYGPGMSSASTKLVDVLQLLDSLRGGAPLIPVGIILSAWDLLEAKGLWSPAAFLAEHLSLLHQFLMAGSDRRPFATWGVSAQGGDYDQGGDALARMESQVDRLVVTDGTLRDHDITRPFRWLDEARKRCGDS